MWSGNYYYPILGEIVNLTPLEDFVYPRPSCTRRALPADVCNSIATTLTGKPRKWKHNQITQGALYGSYRFLNLFFCSTIEPISHTSSIPALRGLVLQHIVQSRRVDWCRVTFR